MDRTNGPDPIWLESELRIGLQSLVLPGDDQFAYHIGACPACELVSEFIRPYQAYVSNFSQRLTSSQIEALGRVAKEIDAMVDEEVECFDRDVLDRLVWVRLRRLAAEALTSLGWPIEAPIPYRQVSPGVFIRP
jgi:hypothetical protein